MGIDGGGAGSDFVANDPTVNLGVAPVDLTTDVGNVRLLVGDTDPINVDAGQGEYFWYSDDELTALLAIKGSVEYTAIYVLRVVAMTPSMQLKKWQSADLAVDGPAITTALRGLIKDIEDGIVARELGEVGGIFQVVNTGPAMPQPARFPQRVPTYRGQPLDPTIPLGLPRRRGSSLAGDQLI